MLGDQGFGGFRAEVAQEDDQGVAAGGVDVRHGLLHVQLVFDGHGALIDVLFAVGLDDRRAALLGQLDGEAVAGYGDDAKLYDRNIAHHKKSLLKNIDGQAVSLGNLRE